ncbi:cation-translocating P-type ATPase [Candidatus Enterococcus clewellii]|uniref:Calcium-translocating P-type ATPase, PMCA-type n=2 Tax=Candidatus Enterococcus clewellii TaxID=1834193 RepID=A0AAQ3Y1G9_9ENTE
MLNEQVEKEQGLTNEEVKLRLEKFGYNTIENPTGKSFVDYLKESMKDITVLILIVATFLSIYVAVQTHPDDFTEPIVIFSIVVLNVYLSIRQQKNAEKSMSELKKLSIPISKVFRNGKLQEIESSQIVPGDSIQLELGDRIPADAKLLTSSNFFVDESFLTGESEPSEKNPDYISTPEDSLGDRKEFVFSGSLVVAGKAKAQVEKTGSHTEIGKISAMLTSEVPHVAPLQIKMQKLGKVLGFIAILAGILAIVIGIVKGLSLEVSIMTAISMAVAAIPEVLPVVVTISLAVGMSNMALKKTIVRTPSTVETVGSVSIICSDKTGTITENKMTVKKINAVNDLSETVLGVTNDQEKNLLFLFYLASAIEEDSVVTANPTELAIKKAIDSSFTKEELAGYTAEFEQVCEIPFDSKRKRMTVLYRFKNRYVSVTKGVFDRLPLSNSNPEYLKKHDELANQAYRVLGVAYKLFDAEPIRFIEEILENELVFAGFIGLIDPARPESHHAVSVAKQAGIETVMITGDHLLTAKKIAADVGILFEGKKAMTGAELSQLSDQDLVDMIDDYRVFARTSPEDKIRIVKAFQKNDEIVAMTGDGVNDAPALKAADVGIAMGGGTEVAKEAADMVLVDDNFATIVQAIEEGRRVYSNIRKSLYAMLGCNISALTIVLISLIIGWGAPVTAIQLLIIKVVADGIPGMSLSVEPVDKDVMKQAPIHKHTSIFSHGLLYKIIEISVVFTLVTLAAILIGRMQSVELSRTMTFIVLGLSTIIHMYNCRSKVSIFKIRFRSNPLLVATTFIGALLIILLVTIPVTQTIFGFVSIGFAEWLWVLGLSFIPLVYIEVKKYFHLF